MTGSELKPLFTIVLVDDEPISMRDQMQEVRSYLAAKGLDLEVLEDETGKNVEGYLKSRHVDVVVTDKNVSDEWGGIDVINSMRRKGYMTVVLFYSVIEDFDTKDVYKEIGRQEFVAVVEDKNIVSSLKSLIDTILGRLEDIVILRGIVISRIIDVELRMNMLFEKYFQVPDNKICHYRDFVLENRYNSFEGKKNTLSKILDSKSIKGEFPGLTSRLTDLQCKRNLLAHARRDDKINNVLRSGGEEEIFGKKEVYAIFNDVLKVMKQLDELDNRLSKL